MVSLSLFCRMISSKKSATFWDHALSSRFSALVPLASIQIAIRRCGTLVVFSFRTHAGRAPQKCCHNGRIEAIRHEQRGDSAAIKAIESS